MWRLSTPFVQGSSLHAPLFVPCTAGMKEDVQLYSERMRKAERLQQAEQKVCISCRAGMRLKRIRAHLQRAMT